MGLFFVYILKSAICLAVFYLFYRLLMTRETFHRFNRFAMLGILLLSCLLPLVEVSVKQPSEVGQTMLTLEQLLMMADAMNTDGTGVVVEQGTATWIQTALLVYLAGIVFFAFRNAYSLSRLLLLLKSGRKESIGNYLEGRKEHVKLVVHDREIAPFSWMKYIVISQKDLEENGREILIHELAHIRNRHSWDLLVADVCIFFQWFNPASWLLKQELQNIHEYEADETVIKEGVDAKQYQLLLIKKAVGTRLYSMANSFNHSKLKKRITMMLKEKSSPWARLKYLYVLPVAAIAVTAFARPEVSNKVEEISRVSEVLAAEPVSSLLSHFQDVSADKVNDLPANAETNAAETAEKVMEMPATVVLVGDTTKPVEIKYIPTEVREELKGTPIFEVVEIMPEFPGGISAVMDYLQKNLRYLEATKKAGTQGRVTVQFVVDKDGSIKDPKVVRPVDKDMDAEAVRLVASMPKWKPGMQKGQAVAVKYTLPVKFSLDGTTKLNGNAIVGPTPLYIVDGKEMQAEELHTSINPDRIDRVEVLKDETAVQRYGEKGKNGVLLITLKKVEGTDKISIPGVHGVYLDNRELGMADVTIYVDNVKVDMKGMKLEDIVSADRIEGIEVRKDKDGKGELYITTKSEAANASAQGEMKVEGQVMDSRGEPVVGASILIEGTTKGTITDVDGKFVLSVSDKNAVLLISYIDMATAKVKVQPKMSVVLKDE